MKKITLLLIFLTACAASQEDVDYLDTEIKDIRKIQAEHTSELSEIREELRRLGGKMEEVSYDQNQKVGGELSNLQANLEQLKKRVPPPSNVPAVLLEQDESLAGNLEPAIGRDFMNALSMLRAGNFKTAVTYIDEAMFKDVNKQLTPVLLYWKGISSEALSDDKGAMLSYNDLVTAYGKHPRAADALLRQGVLFLKNGEKGLAKVTLQKLVSDFPGSDAALAAKTRLSELK